MEDERQRILKMLQAGKIGVEEAEGLLDALGGSKETATRVEPQEVAPEAGPAAGDFGNDLGAGIERWVTGLVNKVTGGAAGEDTDKNRSNLGQMTITKDYLLGMEDGASLKNLGQLTIADDVPEDLIKQKIGQLTNLGQIRGSAKVLRILQSRCVRNLGQFRETAGPGQGNKRSNFTNEGTMVFSKFFLEQLEDGSTFVNEGTVEIGTDVSEELLQQKIGEYENEGETRGPGRLLAILQSRCECNEGSFVETN